jgi:hypothetical protein
MAGQGACRYSTTIAKRSANLTFREHIMNAQKHMEAIFVGIAAIALSISFFTTETQPLTVAADGPLVVHSDVKMPVVTIAAKRLSASEKAALM